MLKSSRTLLQCLVSNLNPSCWNMRLFFFFTPISVMENRLFLMSTYRNEADGIFLHCCFICYTPFRRGINSRYLSGNRRDMYFNLAETRAPGTCCGKQKKGVRKSLWRCRNLHVENLRCWEETGTRQEIFKAERECRKLDKISYDQVTEQDGSNEVVGRERHHWV